MQHRVRDQRHAHAGARVHLVRSAAAAAVMLSLAVAGCASSAPPTKPPGQPPTPKTVTARNPGGDASDGERAALERLLTEPWGTRRDRWRTLRVPLVDWKHWRRVRLWGHPTRATYRYGDNHYAVATVWYQPTQGKDDPDSCLAKFLDYATPVAKSFDVSLGAAKLTRTTQQIDGESRPMLIETIDGSVESLFGGDDYLGAVAAYQSWPGTCLIYGFAVLASEHPDLAARIRDRWVHEGAPQMRWEKKVKEAPPFKTR
jgi:hypothetical protein